MLTGLAATMYVIALLDGSYSFRRHHQMTDTSLNNLSNDEIQNHIKQGHTVLINVSADWCLTCRYNDLKLSSDSLKEIFNTHNVKFIKTRLNNTAIDLMKKYQRHELPFNILYSPLIPDGFVLPKIINENEIKELISNFTLNQPES